MVRCCYKEINRITPNNCALYHNVVYAFYMHINYSYFNASDTICYSPTRWPSFEINRIIIDGRTDLLLLTARPDQLIWDGIVFKSKNCFFFLFLFFFLSPFSFLLLGSSSHKNKMNTNKRHLKKFLEKHVWKLYAFVDVMWCGKSV